MSQLMESMLSRGLSPAASSEIPSVQQPQGVDFVRVLWRWKWLPILGALVGAGVGYMFFTKAPERYQSFALVQVVSSVAPTTGMNYELYDPDKVAVYRSKNDESRVIKSHKVLSNAVEVGNLTKLFPGMTESQIIFELMDPKNGVIVAPAEKSERVLTEQLNIAYISGDPDTSQAVVNAVVAGYQKFLDEEFKFVDDEVVKLFTQVERKLDQELKTHKSDYEKFLADIKEQGVLFNVNEPVNHFFEAAMRNQSKLDEKRLQRNQLKSILDTVENAMKSGDYRAQELLLLINDNSELVKSTIFGQIFEDQELGGNDVLESERLERSELLLLQTELDLLLENYGEKHPNVRRIRSSIQAVEKKIASAKEDEREFEKKNAELKAKNNQAKKRILNKEGQSTEPGDGLGADVGNSDISGTVDKSNTIEATIAADFPDDAQSFAEDAPDIEEQTNFYLQISLNTLTQRYNSLKLEEEEIQRWINEDTAKSQIVQGFLLTHEKLKNQAANLEKFHEELSEKLKGVELFQSSSNRKILQELVPAVQGGYHGPFSSTYTAAGALAGVLLMSALALLMDLADRSYRSPDEIVSDLGKPVLGHIPAMDLPNIKKVVDTVDPSLITIHHSRGRIAEAFRSVRTGLFFSSRGSELKVVQITSPVPGDGKSTLSSNLAVAMAQSGRRVLLIDADFRRPRLQKLFGFDADVGVAQLVAGQCELDDATYTTCVANLSIMPGGKRPNNPAELLSSSRFAELVEIVREKYDIVIIDTPPLLAVSDPSVVASVVDGVVVCMRLRRNVKPLATRAFRILESVDAQVLGLVVNGVSTEAAYGGYGYNYSYNDYRYSYRSSYGYGYGKYGKYGKYGYGKYGKYTSYSTGYIEDRQAEAAEVSTKNDADTQS